MDTRKGLMSMVEVNGGRKVRESRSNITPRGNAGNEA
jgi:hypothetical protein